MSKKTTRVIALTLVVLLGLVGVLAVAIDALAEPAPPPRDQYTLSIQVIPEANALRVDQRLRYTNRTGEPLSQVLFNLYPNAYRRLITTPIEIHTIDSAYPSGFTPGGVDFFLVERNGRPADWGVQGESEAFLRVQADLAPGESCEFRFGFELLLPYARADFGFTALGYQLHAFYPLAAPWDPALREFMLINPMAVGSTLVSDPADYHLDIIAPPATALAAPGTLVREIIDGGEHYTIQAENLRQMGLLFSAKYRESQIETRAGTAIVAMMSDARAASFALGIAREAMDLFEEALGTAPTSRIVIAEANLFEGAMMQPGMILVDSSLLNARQRDELEYQIANCLARQWFFEKASHNPAREPWLSHAPAAYMALRYYASAYDEVRFLDELNRRVLPALKLTMPGQIVVNSESLEFASVNDFQIVTSERGAAVMYELSLLMGTENLYRALRMYLDSGAGRICSAQDFANALSAVVGDRMDEVLQHLLCEIDDYATLQMDWYE